MFLLGTSSTVYKWCVFHIYVKTCWRACIPPKMPKQMVALMIYQLYTPHPPITRCSSNMFFWKIPHVSGEPFPLKKKPCPQGKLAIFFLDQSHSLLVKTILVEKSIFRFNATLLQTNIDVGNPSFADHVPKKTIVFPHSCKFYQKVPL